MELDEIPFGKLAILAGSTYAAKKFYDEYKRRKAIKSYGGDPGSDRDEDNWKSTMSDILSQSLKKGDKKR